MNTSKLRRVRVLSASALLSFSVGCATSDGATREEVDALRKDLREQRERQAIMDRRIADMDARLALIADKVSTRPTAEARPGQEGRPQLDVVRVGPQGRKAPPQPPPDESEPKVEREDDINDGGMYLHPNRQVLLERDANGRAVSRKQADVSDEKLAAQEEETIARTDPRTQYNQSMREFKARKYAEAARGFEDVADRWPEHPLADNAVYWTGVCYLQQGEMALAINELQKVPVRYPKSDKVPDALFSLAEAYQRVGDKESAKAMLTQLVEMYPAAEKAGEARENLARLNKQ